MRKRLTGSALFALAVFTAAAAGQPPAALTPPPPLPGPKGVEEKPVAKKPAEPTDAAIAAALTNDPDVKMARAKMQLAEAELAKARRMVTLKVVALRGDIEQLKAKVALAQIEYDHTNQMAQRGVIPQPELLAARAKLEAAKAALAPAEAEWKLLTGSADGTAAGSDPTRPADVPTLLAALLEEHERAAHGLRVQAAQQAWQARKAIEGPVPARIRAALDKPVKLGAKGENVTFEQAWQVFSKNAGLDVPVRGKYPTFLAIHPELNTNNNGVIIKSEDGPIVISSEGEELPVGAWLQLFEDKASSPDGKKRYRFYVREYGLLISDANAAPPDALTLTELWKQKPPAKDAKVDPAGKP